MARTSRFSKHDWAPKDGTTSFIYSPCFSVLWNGKRTRQYLMHRALAICRRMRARGHTVMLLKD